MWDFIYHDFFIFILIIINIIFVSFTIVKGYCFIQFFEVLIEIF